MAARADPAAAEEFLERYAAEHPAAADPQRLAQVLDEIEQTGTYTHTLEELTFGARVAWRNASRCIGRLYWQSLVVRDRRKVAGAAQVAAECVAHLRETTNGGKVRPTITIFAPDSPQGLGPRIWNEQLIRYAGWRDGGQTLGDPRYADFTDLCVRLGWTPAGRSRFDVLPLLIEAPGEPMQVFTLPGDAVMEVALRHPQYPWFAELGLRWHVIPALAMMCLEIGGLHYQCAPFNGWYMSSEIGARNLADADRYDLLPAVAKRLGLDVADERSLWKDRALVELNVAVLWSFDQAKVTITDHHTESRRFLVHLAKEEKAGRSCPADWSWIVPPISGGLTPVFHRYYDEADLSPAFRHHPEALARARGYS